MCELDNKSPKNIKTYKYETLKSNEDYLNPFLLIILIIWINNNHYELLLPLNMNIYQYPLEYNNKLYNKNKIINKNKNTSPKTVKKEIDRNYDNDKSQNKYNAENN